MTSSEFVARKLFSAAQTVKLVIVHFHLRPGGIRRVIELATPHLLRDLPQIKSVAVATGEADDQKWNRNFAKLLAPIPLQLAIQPAFGYVSEQRKSPAALRKQIASALQEILAEATADNCLVWAHNLGIGRNVPLAQELVRVCTEHKLTLISHHHDLWFDNRWLRWPEIRRSGFPTLASVARAIFPPSAKVRHAAINHEDANILVPRLGHAAAWLPNLATRNDAPTRAGIHTAKRWLQHRLGAAHQPVWILPCRLLRRKNVAEALLLTRWLRPEAWLVTTGGASSADERPYFEKLQNAAHQHHWRLRLGVLQGDEKSKPSISELLGASEAVLLTSIQEGFGLPYLEAAAAERPLLARQLPNIAPDLARFGFRFPQSYSEILVHRELFDWASERSRQQKLFRRWRCGLPHALRSRVGKPVVLTARGQSQGIPFSRLTLTAQLEVLSARPELSWNLCAPLNPFLPTWRRRAQQQKLQTTHWPHSASRWLGGTTYAHRFSDLARRPVAIHAHPESAPIQTAFLEKKLCPANLYPLLWATET